jgi:hypothetical protein
MGRFNERNPEASEIWGRLQAFVVGNEITTDYLVIVE